MHNVSSIPLNTTSSPTFPSLVSQRTPFLKELMRYFFGSDVAEPDAEDIPSMATFRALGLDPDREPDALKVTKAMPAAGGGSGEDFHLASLLAVPYRFTPPSSFETEQHYRLFSR